MSAVHWLIALPLIGAGVLALLRERRLAANVNFLFCLASFGVSVWLMLHRPPITPWWLIDDLNAFFIVLTAFIGTSTAVFSRGYIGYEIESGRLSERGLRAYHVMYQLVLGMMLLALCANNIGLLWVGVEAATLITVVMVSLYRTRPALEAAWKYFIIGSVAIALALFGTLLIYLAAQPVAGGGLEGMAWTALRAAAPRMNAQLLELAFVFLMVGYGTKCGFVPFHAWMPDAHAEGPTPISAVLSGLMLNVALYALLRYKIIMTGNAGVFAPGLLLMIMGMITIGTAGLMLYRRRDLKRFFAFSSIEHLGIMAFAFGLGGSIANFAGLLHMVMHSIVKSGIFFAVGRMTQIRGSQRAADLTGFTRSHPLLGWGFVLLTLAIMGLPPFGLFLSEFLIITSILPRQPWLALPFCAGLLIGFGALLLRLQQIAFGPPGLGAAAGVRAGVPLSTLVPLYVHIALAILAGVAMPNAVADWFRAVAETLG